MDFFEIFSPSIMAYFKDKLNQGIIKAKFGLISHCDLIVSKVWPFVSKFQLFSQNLDLLSHNFDLFFHNLDFFFSTF